MELGIGIYGFGCVCSHKLTCDTADKEEALYLTGIQTFCNLEAFNGYCRFALVGCAENTADLGIFF